LQFLDCDPSFNLCRDLFRIILKSNEHWNCLEIETFLSSFYSYFGEDFNYREVSRIFLFLKVYAECTKLRSLVELILNTNDEVVSSLRVEQKPLSLLYRDEEIAYTGFKTFVEKIKILKSETFSSFSEFSNTVRVVINSLQQESFSSFVKEMSELEGKTNSILKVLSVELSQRALLMENCEFVKSNAIYHFNLVKNEITIFSAAGSKGLVPAAAILLEKSNYLHKSLLFNKNRLNDTYMHYLQTTQELYEMLKIMQQLHFQGHPDFQEDIYILDLGKNMTAENDIFKQLLLAKSEFENCRLLWEDHKIQISSENELLYLFSLEQRNQFLKLILDCEVKKILLILSIFLKNENQHLIIESCVKDVLKRHKDNPDHLFPNLLIELKLRGLFKRCLTKNYRGTSSRQNCMYTSPSDLFSILVLIQAIFQDPPLPIQILWCSENTSGGALKLFLNRSKIFPGLKFLLVKVDLLPLHLQETLLDLTHNGSIRNLHCIDCNPSILETSKLFRLIDVGYLQSLSKMKESLGKWAEKSVNRADPLQHRCFLGPSGCGKTFHMRKWLATFQFSYTIYIAESMDWERVISELSNVFKYDTASAPMAIAFIIDAGRNYLTLLQDINNLLFQLICLSAVSLPSSELAFSVPNLINCQFALELPYLDLDKTKIDFFLSENLPVVLALFESIYPMELKLEINDEARFVSKYLHANETRIINKLSSHLGGDKDIVIVLGSSNVPVGYPLTESRNCFLQVFFNKDRIDSEDRVGLVLYNSDRTTVPLDFWFRNKRTVVATASSAHAEVRSKMWEGILTGLSLLSECNLDRKRVLIVIADGAIDSEEKEIVKEKLSSSFLDVQVILFCTNMSRNYEKLLKGICIKNESNDLLLPFSGDHLELDPVWVF
jgi:hypothetical protein